MQFSLFCLVAEDREGLPDHARLAAYLYVRATDSWRTVCDEFGLCPDFNEQISNSLFSVAILEVKDKLLREFAFTESEAKDYFRKQYGISKIQTLADETKSIREVLGLPLK